MFGDENNLVRLDMSEYGEKTSVTKIYGSSPGYVGYEEGGVLTEAIKRKNRCVLLLDEIEKHIVISITFSYRYLMKEDLLTIRERL